MAWRHLVTDSRIWRDIKTSFAWTDWGTDIGEIFMVEKQSKKFIVHFCFYFTAYIPVYPACLWSLRWVYAVKKTRRLVYGVYPPYTNPNTPLIVVPSDFHGLRSYTPTICPVFFALMSRKTTELYETVLQKHRSLLPQYKSTPVISDIEEAPAAAVRRHCHLSR